MYIWGKYGIFSFYLATGPSYTTFRIIHTRISTNTGMKSATDKRDLRPG